MDDYLPINTIKSYFSRRAKEMCDGKVVVNRKNVDEPEVTHDEERENAVHLVDMNINNSPNS